MRPRLPRPALAATLALASLATGPLAPGPLAPGPALALPTSAGGETVAQAMCRLITGAAEGRHIPVGFFTRLIWQESAFRADAASPAGAQGIAQFMPGTAAERGLADPFDPEQAVPASAAPARRPRGALRQPRPRRRGLQRRAAARRRTGSPAAAACPPRRATTSSASPAARPRTGPPTPRRTRPTTSPSSPSPACNSPRRCARRRAAPARWRPWRRPSRPGACSSPATSRRAWPWPPSPGRAPASPPSSATSAPW